MNISGICETCVHDIDRDLVSMTCPFQNGPECEAKKLREKRSEKNKKPAPMPEPVTYYDKSGSRYPETIRMSFEDGHTEIYDRRVNQPRPGAYVNNPARRKAK